MSKIIAREVAPEDVDFSLFFDDDGMKSTGGENCAVYIPETQYMRGFNANEYNDIVELAENIIEAFDDIKNGETWNAYGIYSNYKEAMEDYGIKYTSKKCSLLKKWAEKADTDNTDDIAEFLTITTGKKYNSRSYNGYSQGDYCEVVYCEEIYPEESIDMIGKFWLGCGTEFSIDDCYGYYVPDNIRWEKDDKLKKYLADECGCKLEDLEVQIYTGCHTVADYAII